MLSALDGIIAGEIANHFCIRLEHSQRRAQIVRGIGDEVALHRVYAVDLMAGIGQRFGETFGFIIAAAVKLDIIFAMCELLRVLCDADNRLCQAIGNNHGENCGDQHKKHCNNNELPTDDADSCGDRR